MSSTSGIPPGSYMMQFGAIAAADGHKATQCSCCLTMDRPHG